MSEPMGDGTALWTRAAEETEAIAERFATMLVAGDVVTLAGDLGAGKTTFTRGLARGLGSRAPVSSPTFTLVHEYGGGRLPIFHVDAYRLRGTEDAISIGLEDYLARGDGVVIIEWPENVAALLPPERLDVTLTEEGDARRIVFTPHGHRWEGASPC